MIPLSIHLPVCPFIQNEHAFKLGLWYIIQSTGYVIKWLTTYSNDFFCIMMKFSFSRVLTWMYFYKYLTDAIFLKSSDVWCYWVLLWFSHCSIFCFNCLTEEIWALYISACFDVIEKRSPLDEDSIDFTQVWKLGFY